MFFSWVKNVLNKYFVPFEKENLQKYEINLPKTIGEHDSGGGHFDATIGGHALVF